MHLKIIFAIFCLLLSQTFMFAKAAETESIEIPQATWNKRGTSQFEMTQLNFDYPGNYQMFWCDTHLAQTVFPGEAPDFCHDTALELAFYPWLKLARIPVANDIFRCTLDAQLRIKNIERLTPAGLWNDSPEVKSYGSSLYMIWKGQHVVNHCRQYPQLLFRIIPLQNK